MTLPAPAATSPQPQWQVPAPVKPLRLSDVVTVGRHLSRWLGIRPRGWVMLLVATGLLLTGGLLGWLELRVAGLAGLVLVLLGALLTIGRPRLQVSLQIPGSHVTVGQRASGRILVRNAGRRRTLPGSINLPIGRQLASLGLPSLTVGAQHAADFVIPTRRRSVVTIGPAQSVQGDPFGLMGRDAQWTDLIEFFVHPATVSLPGRQTGFVHDLEGHPTQKLSSSDMSFHALREYVPGDDRRHVHWRSSAKTGSLMVRQFEETRQSRIAVAIDLADSAYVSDDDFETAVSVAGSFVQQAFREENPVALVTNVEAHPGLTANRIMNELSRLERLQRTHVTEVIRMVRDREPAASIVIVVTGSRVRADRLRRAATLLSVDARVICVRVEPQERLRVETLSNVTTIRLPHLDDLPRAVRRTVA